MLYQHNKSPKQPILFCLLFAIVSFGLLGSDGIHIQQSVRGSSTVFFGYPQVPGEEPPLEFSWAHGFPLQPDFQLWAPIALLFHVDSGIILFEQAIDQPIPPASITKLMTMHLLMVSAEEKGIQLSDQISFTEEAFAENAPPRSSLMFLGPGQVTTLEELLLGLAISSGNDASVAAAQVVAGSVPGFVDLMNREAIRLGLTQTYFEEPSGYSPFNQTTARDLGRFLGYYLRRWPQALESFHGVREFTYPAASNLLPGASRRFLGITQPNRNGLVHNFPGATGIKTGFIDQSGYNLSFSATRGSMNLAGVVLGVEAPSTPEGSRRREEDAERLLEFGFTHYGLGRIEIPPTHQVRLWESNVDRIHFEGMSFSLPIPRSSGAPEVHRLVPTDLFAPITPEAVVSVQQVVGSDGKTIGTLPLRSGVLIESSSGFRLFWDRVVLFFRRLFGYPEPERTTGSNHAEKQMSYRFAITSISTGLPLGRAAT
jgi:D-alanyl-D-alanine carboxypeptidase (penicillin-binding protein 5/6)